MQKRNPIAVALLPLVTFGIYGIYWYVKTKGELNAKGNDIPTAWLIVIPIVSIWWVWKYSEAVEKVTGGKMQGVIAFLLLWALGSIGAAIIQNTYNELDGASVASGPTAPVETPVASTTTVPATTTPVATAPATPAPTPPPPSTPLIQ